MDKKKQIEELYIDALNNDEAPNVFADRILFLFGVSTRTFKIGDKVEWRGMKLIVVKVGLDEVLIATSENVDDDNYNDWWVSNVYVRKNNETERCTIPNVTARLFNYKCTKCYSIYTKLKKPLNYSDCQVYKGRNPNPILCGGRLISAD